MDITTLSQKKTHKRSNCQREFRLDYHSISVCLLFTSCLPVLFSTNANTLLNSYPVTLSVTPMARRLNAWYRIEHLWVAFFSRKCTIVTVQLYGVYNCEMRVIRECKIVILASTFNETTISVSCTLSIDQSKIYNL